MNTLIEINLNQLISSARG